MYFVVELFLDQMVKVSKIYQSTKETGNIYVTGFPYEKAVTFSWLLIKLVIAPGEIEIVFLKIGSHFNKSELEENSSRYA